MFFIIMWILLTCVLSFAMPFGYLGLDCFLDGLLFLDEINTCTRESCFGLV